MPLNRRRFVQAAATTVAGSSLLPLSGCAGTNLPSPVTDTEFQHNWASNYTYRAKTLYAPRSVTEVQELVRSLDKQKALGSRHCFNNIADSPGSQISTRNLNSLVAIDEGAGTVTVEAGARYGDFARTLYDRGYALHNLASLPHITVAGACATGTHGSGVENGNLATSVVSLELVRPDGELVVIDRNHPDFPAVTVGLGCFGIVTKLTLALQPAFDVRQEIYVNLPFASAVDNFDAIMASGYSVSLFTDWLDGNVSEVWIKRREDRAYPALDGEFYGAIAAAENMHPIAGLSTDAVSDQMGRPGPWYDRLPHFKMEFTPSAGKEIQSEFFVPREHAVEAFRALEAMGADIQPRLLISEVRTVKADNFWLSPAYRRDSVAFHFTWKPETEAVLAILPEIEQTLAPFTPRPHWGKVFTMDKATLRSRYPQGEAFIALANAYDPEGKFRNAYLEQRLI